MTGVEESIWERFQSAVSEVKKIEGYETCFIIEPLGIHSFENGIPEDYESWHTWGWYMGEDIKVLADSNCTDIFFCKGWEKSKGCRVEQTVAKVLGINKIYQE